MIRVLLFALLVASPVSAGVKEAVNDHALPAAQSFAVQAKALAVNAQADCTAPAVIPSYHNTFDAWLGLQHLGFGPLEVEGRALAISFWPDKRGMVASTVSRLVADEDAAVRDPAEFAEVSVAARGLFALERLLFEEEYAGYGRDDYTCQLVTAIARDLDRMASSIHAEWLDQAKALLTAGEPGNSTYLSQKEASQRLYTSLLAGLEFNADQRLGRPLGTFDRPRPERAEARRSDRSLRNAIVSLEALQDLAIKMADAPTPATDAAFETVLANAVDLNDPVFSSVEDPAGRLKVEIVQQGIKAAATAIQAELGVQLGVGTGFNSADGD